MYGLFRPANLALLLMLVLLHLPFMAADPDPTVTVMSRGPWTDEGLNTSQVRNFVNHGVLDMAECDNLIKTPFFGFVLVPFYSVFGTQLVVGRWVVLGSVLFVLWLMLAYRGTRAFATAFAVLGLMQFHVFHFSHYSMAEMMGVALTLLGIFLLTLWGGKDNRAYLAAACLSFGLAFLSKVTFAYVLVLPFGARFLVFLSERVRGRDSVTSLLLDGGIMAAVTGAIALIFHQRWYGLHREVFDLVRADQGSDRFDLATPWGRALFNWGEFIDVAGLSPFLILAALALIILVRTGLEGRAERTLLYGLLGWLLLESHRLLLMNPPTRYLVPLFAAMLAFVAFALTRWHGSLGRKATAGLLMLGMFAYNLSHWHSSLHRRSFVFQEVNAYLAPHNLHHASVLGVWGTGLAAGTGARLLPVWNGFMNHEQPLERHHPRIIFAEHDEADSRQAFAAQGIDLHAASDSMRTFDLWRYKVNLYWMKQETVTSSPR